MSKPSEKKRYSIRDRDGRLSSRKRIASLYLKKAMTQEASVALMKFLSAVARHLGAGEHIYVVGGAVRNFVLGAPVKDVDVVVDSVALHGKDSEWFAKEVAKAIPAPSNLTTNQYGVAILTVTGDWMVGGMNLKGEVIEIANTRKESYGGAGGKGYKPHTVEPATIKEDVLRREFTFNTMLWRLLDLAHGPDKAEIIDLTGCGLSDLREGKMRCPRDPDIVFSDDPTRLLRAIKFLNKYGLEPTPDTEASIKRNAHKLKSAPYNAIADLLIHTLLVEPTAKKALVEMKRLGLLDVVAEMVEENKAFKATLANWAGDQRLKLLFELLDLGFPVAARFTFLPPAQQARVKELSFYLPETEVEHILGLLKQPGKGLDIPALVGEFGLAGKQIGQLTELSRELLLAYPALAKSRDQLTNAVRHRLSGSRVASLYLQRA